MKVNGVEFRERMLALAVQSCSPGDELHKVQERAAAYARFVLGPAVTTAMLEPWQCVEFDPLTYGIKDSDGAVMPGGL